MSEKNENEVQFPIIHDECPTCGCKERLVETVYQENTKMKKGQTAALNRGLLALTDQTGMLSRLSVPALAYETDACLKCGTIYIVRASKVNIPAEQSVLGGTKHNLPPDFLPGNRG